MKKVAFVTGAGGYLGSEAAIILAKNNIKVAVCDINSETTEKTVEKIKKFGGMAKGYIADVSNYAEIEDAINSAAKDFGGLDILVNVAGGSCRIAGQNVKPHPITEQAPTVIETVVRINLLGTIWACRAAGKIMVKNGKGGKIINFSSAVGIQGLSWASDYAASKGGIISFTKSFAKEMGPYKINVNAIAPGVVCRPEVDTESESGHHYAFETNVLGEMCTAEDIANLVEFLASDKARFITGQTYVCDGGRTLSMKGTD